MTKRSISQLFQRTRRGRQRCSGAARLGARRHGVRLWIDGLLAGGIRASRRARRAQAEDGPLVLWASQTGNAEEFAAGWPAGSAARSWSTWTTGAGGSGRRRATCWSSPARSATAARPTTAPDFWDASIRPTRPRWTASGTRCWASATGPTTTSVATRSRSTAGSPRSARRRMLERAECEAYDDEPMDRWAEQVTALVGARSPRRADRRQRPPPRPSRSPAPSRPGAAVPQHPADRAGSRKEVRQFGFDISEHDVTYAAGDSLGVYATNDPATVDAWLAATGLRGDDVGRGRRQSSRRLRDALIVVLRHLPGDAEPAALRRRTCADATPPRRCAHREPSSTSGWSTATGSTSCRSSPSAPSPSSGRRCWCG